MQQNLFGDFRKLTEESNITCDETIKRACKIAAEKLGSNMVKQPDFLPA